jgi:hypothetical protein
MSITTALKAHKSLKMLRRLSEQLSMKPALSPAFLYKMTVLYVFLTIAELLVASLMNISSPVEEISDGT